jgi:hypothetical protein
MLSSHEILREVFCHTEPFDDDGCSKAKLIPEAARASPRASTMLCKRSHRIGETLILKSISQDLIIVVPLNEPGKKKRTYDRSNL